MMVEPAMGMVSTIIPAKSRQRLKLIHIVAACLVSGWIVYNVVAISFFSGWICQSKDFVPTHKVLPDERGNVLLKQASQNPETSLSCEWVSKQVESIQSIPRTEVNALRRQVAMMDPACYQRHKATFIDDFLHRLPTKSHLVLHIPKAAGTTLCHVAKHNNLNATKSNCWYKDFSAFWCCFPPRSNPVTCHDLKAQYPRFVMNENYLDHPICEQDRAYAALLRDPVDRAISHLVHLNYFLTIYEEVGESGWRLNLGQSNYITWSLVAGRYTYPYVYPNNRNVNNATASSQDDSYNGVASEPRFYVPQPEDLDHAKKTLGHLDFVMDMTDNNCMTDKCLKVILKLMGMDPNSSVGEVNSASYYGKDFTKKGYRRDVYHRLNDLDIPLFEYAQEIMRVDCEFFLSLPG